MSIEKVLSSISNWSVVLPFIIGISFFKSHTKNSRLIFIVISLAVIPQLINAFDSKNSQLKNLFYNSYTPLEFLCFYALFKPYIFRSRAIKFYKIIGVFYLFISIIFFVTKNVVNDFLDEWVCVNNLIYTLWILYIFYEQYSESEIIRIDTSESIFWIMTGLLVYASFSTLYFSVYYYAQKQNFSSLKIIHHLVNTYMYVCFTIALYRDKSTEKM